MCRNKSCLLMSDRLQLKPRTVLNLVKDVFFHGEICVRPVMDQIAA